MLWLRRFAGWIASVLPFIMLFCLILYPIYKRLYAGLGLVTLGAVIALVPKLTPRLNRFMAKVRPRTWLLGLTLIGLILRLPLIAYPPNPQSDFLIYLHTAQNVADGLGFGNYLFYPPGQAAFLSPWVRLFGSNLHSLALVESLVSLATISITYYGFAATGLGNPSRSAAMWASGLVAFYPSIVIWSGTLGHETLVMFLAAVIFWIVAKISQEMEQTKWWIACGVVTGLITLVRPTYLAAPILIFLSLWICSKNLRQSLIAGGVILLFCLLAVAPWTWRNYQHFHKLALVSTNFGITMLSSNATNSDGIYMDTMNIGKGLDPIAQDKLQMRMALHSIKVSPIIFVERTAKRIVYMWGGETSIPDAALENDPSINAKVRQILRLVVQLSWCIFVAASCLGVIWFRQSNVRLTWSGLATPFAWTFLWTALLFSIHALLEPAARHHMELLPLLAGFYLPLYGYWVSGSVEKRVTQADPELRKSAAAAGGAGN